MNLVERGVRAVDGVQQRNRILGFVFGVVKKYGDDRGPSLAVLLTYYGFLSLFPLLLVLTTILGFIGNREVSKTVLGETLAQFPVFGQQIGKNAAHPISGNGVALGLGIAASLYGALGVAQAAQHAMAQVWNVPGVRRPGLFPRLARGLGFFAILGTGMAVTGFVSGFVTAGGQHGVIRAAGFVVEVLLNAALYLVAFRVLTPKVVATRDLAVGAAVGGLGYSVLLSVGTSLTQHQLRHTQAVYGQFAFVLGLMAWLFLVSQVTLYAAEVNVVLVRRLWPRSIVQPPLTEADRRVLHDIARQEERRPEERVGVGFDPQAAQDAGTDAAGDRVVPREP